MSDQLAALRKNAMNQTFGEKLRKHETKLLNTLLSRVGSKENPLTEKDALIGLHVIKSVRGLQKSLERDTQEAHNV